MVPGGLARWLYTLLRVPTRGLVLVVLLRTDQVLGSSVRVAVARSVAAILLDCMGPWCLAHRLYTYVVFCSEFGPSWALAHGPGFGFSVSVAVALGVAAILHQCIGSWRLSHRLYALLCVFAQSLVSYALLRIDQVLGVFS